MEVHGYTHITLAVINFMMAAVVSKTATLTGPVQSFGSMATSGELKNTKEMETSFPKALDDQRTRVL